jgi:hypothetical protein
MFFYIAKGTTGANSKAINGTSWSTQKAKPGNSPTGSPWGIKNCSSLIEEYAKCRKKNNQNPKFCWSEKIQQSYLQVTTNFRIV